MSGLSPGPRPPREVAVTAHLPGDILGDLESFPKEFVATPELDIQVVGLTRLQVG